jgi:hypothetical protein
LEGQVNRIISLLLVFVMLAPTGCQTAGYANIATKDSYRPVRENLQAKKLSKALNSFPDKEQDQFITTVEKAWLQLLQNSPKPEVLTALSDDLENRKTVFVTKEAQKFFFKESNGSYMPAEHEVIFLHILAGLSFAKKNMPKEARVEAQRASRYLQGHYGDFAGNFDDPALRILLAGLWLYVGEWQHARVDLRVAAKLSKDYRWLKPISDAKNPPPNFVIAMRGVGPEVVWMPEDENSGRWGLKFVATEKAKKLGIRNGSQTLTLKNPVNTMEWYARHTDRDPPTRTLVDNVRHGADVAAGVGGAIVLGTLAALAALTVIAIAVGLTVGVVAITGEKSPALLDVSLELSGVMLRGAASLATNVLISGSEKAGGVYDDAADESQFYRYVRFLPTYIYAGAPEKLMNSAKAKFNKNQEPLLNLKGGSSRVMIFYSPI